MPFWSSQKLEARAVNLIHPFKKGAIDCNAYTLHMGQEIYITPTPDAPTPNRHTKQRLAVDESFTIPPGQFAYLLTSEIVNVPTDAIAFISMKAGIKFRGLVNVSGFHVDPGYQGRLIFAVFNAGPTVIHLQQGQPLFLIWYADLEQTSAANKNGEGKNEISTEMINNVSGQLYSLANLELKIKEEDKKLEARIQKLETTQAAVDTKATILLTLIVGAILAFLKFSNFH